MDLDDETADGLWTMRQRLYTLQILREVLRNRGIHNCLLENLINIIIYYR
jgi:hypothetical protein